MNADPLSGGSARALTKRLAAAPDRLALYAALTDGGRPDTLLIETMAGPSLIMEQAAVRIECRGLDVDLHAVSAAGHVVLRMVERGLSHRVVEQAEDRLRLRFPAPEGDDSEARLLHASPFDTLRALVSGLRNDSPEEPFTIAVPGVIAFDHVDLFEDYPANAEDVIGHPDFVFWLAESLIVIEPGLSPRIVCTAFATDDPAEAERAHFGAAQRLAELAARCEQPVPEIVAPIAGPALAEAEPDLDDAAYCDVVTRMKAHILAGDVYQIVPSRTFRAACPNPLKAFAAVRRLDPSPYMFFISGPEHLLFGASPETSVRVKRDGDWPIVEVKPIAGTRPRGSNSDEDDRLEADLRLDHKEIAEHMMLVDLARNDVARVSMPGSRRVAALMSVERYARVMHLVSSVKGSLGLGFDALHALQACLNVGTLSGAPKIRATELLRLTERTKRGPYGGAVGWLNGDGMLDTGVVIRSAVVKDGFAYVRAGAGVVHDSDPQAEADETRRKASAILSAIAAAEADQ